MKLNEQKLDKIFREKLEGFEVTPPASVWDGIQNKLKNQKSKKGIIFYRIIAIAAVVVFALIAGWLLDIYPPTSKTISENKVKESPAKPTKTENAPIENIKFKEVAANNQVNRPAASGLNQAKNETTKSSEEIPDSGLWYRDLEFQMITALKGHIRETKLVEKLRSKNIFKNITDDLTANDRELVALNSKSFSATSGKNNNWEIGFRVSPGYSSQRTEHAENYRRDMTDSNTEGNADLSGGISLGYKASKRWRVESGIYYAQNGQSSGNSSQLFSKNTDALYGAAANYFKTPVTIKQGQMAMNSTAGVIEFSKTPNNTELLTNLDAQSNFSNSLLTSGEFSQVFDFLEVPLYLKYNLIDQKINVDILGGISANWLVGNNAYINTGGTKENIGITSGISSFHYSGTVGLGVDYSLGKRISVSIEPRFNYYLNSINKSREVNYHPYRIGVYSGINYRF